MLLPPSTRHRPRETETGSSTWLKVMQTTGAWISFRSGRVRMPWPQRTGCEDLRPGTEPLPRLGDLPGSALPPLGRHAWRGGPGRSEGSGQGGESLPLPDPGSPAAHLDGHGERPACPFRRNLSPRSRRSPAFCRGRRGRAPGLFFHYMLGENFRLQGDMAGAWEGYLQAFPLLRDIGPSVFFRNTLMEAAIASLRQGLPATSLLFHEEGVRLAEVCAGENHLGMSEALLRRSSAHLTLGELGGGAPRPQQVLVYAEQIAPGRWRDRLLADLDFALGELELKAAPGRALIPLTAALDASLQSQMRYRLPLFYETRARAFLASGDEAQARADLERGVAEIEAQRNRACGPAGAAAFEQARSLFDAMVDLESRRGHPAVAFEYAERVRARSLLDMADSTGEARVLGIEEAQRELPPGIALVEFAVLKDRTLAWVVTDESFELVTLRIGEQPLESLVKEFRSAILGGGNARPPGIRLYGLLIEPLQPWIGGRDLIVVPDRSLHLLPFAALVDPATRRYLLEERAVAKAPSTTLWVKALQRDRILARGGAPGSARGRRSGVRPGSVHRPAFAARSGEGSAGEVADVHTGLGCSSASKPPSAPSWTRPSTAP